MTSKTNYIYLVRHGENKANITKEFSHKQVDYSLNPKGVLQAKQTAAHFATQPINALYSSPLKRAQETAQTIAAELNLPVTVVEGFREFNVGDLEGLTATPENWKQYSQVVTDWFNGQHEAAFPGGEDYHSLLARMEAALRSAVAGRHNEHIVIVGHGGIFTVTLKDICANADPFHLQHRAYQNCAITRITLTEIEGELHGELLELANDDHLHGPARDFVSGAPQHGV